VIVAIEVAGFAGHHGSTADPISQRKARLLPATPTFTFRPNTELAAFGGIDAKQSNAPAMDFEGVAVETDAIPTMRSCATAPTAVDRKMK
jgi:hypothetical protein